MRLSHKLNQLLYESYFEYEKCPDLALLRSSWAQLLCGPFLVVFCYRYCRAINTMSESPLSSCYIRWWENIYCPLVWSFLTGTFFCHINNSCIKIIAGRSHLIGKGPHLSPLHYTWQPHLHLRNHLIYSRIHLNPHRYYFWKRCF